jgi:hypothetical protein
MRLLAAINPPTTFSPSKCPGCRTTGKLLPILYGEHSPEAEEQSRQGEVVLGVSCWHEGPRWECLVCGYRLK